MAFLLVGTVAGLAAFLTLFSGFGLGTLLLPAFGLFFPPAAAVAMTACVHFANNLAKLALFARKADARVLLRFGLPAWAAAALGAWLLGRLDGIPALATYTVGQRVCAVTPLGLGLGGVMAGFAVLEMTPAFARLRIDARWQPLGGFLSGFFGGLSGHQGALRSAFLIKSGLDKDAFVGTGVVLACGVDAVRMGVYGLQGFAGGWHAADGGLILFAMLCAWIGVAVGARRFRKVTLDGLQRFLAVLLGIFGSAWMAGLI